MFAVLLGVGLLTFILSMTRGAALGIISTIIFFTLGVILLADYDVTYSETFSGVDSNDCPPANPCTTTKYLIGDADPNTENNGEWLGWIFIAIGLVAAILFITNFISLGM